MPQPAVAFGGPSPEHDVSVLTGLQAVRALAAIGRPATALYWSRSADWFEVDPDLEAGDFVEGPPKGASSVRLVTGPGGGFVGSGRLGRERPVEIEAVVNCCHGGPGEDGTLQAALDLAGVAYTGPNVAGAAIGLDKLAFAGAVAAAGLPTLPRAALSADASPPGFAGPYIVKPRFGGSSIGIEVVQDWPTAQALARTSVHLRRGAMAEPYRADADDLNVAIRSHPSLELSAIERPLRTTGGAPILGYADKYVGGEGMASAPRQLPADIPDDVAAEVRRIASAVADLASLRGVARLDFLYDGTELLVNELNTIPGSLARYLWVDPPLPFGRLLTDLLDEATSRPSAHYSSAGADGSALRSAGSIASKLG
ncbi:MAG TPA: hypothetical protein VM030_06100 [Acidimicrobiales bacterium]|nr:hypothetical protein [Acidimicrobiales bacterium]